MSVVEFVYTVALGATGAALPLLSRGEGKLARGVRGRRDALERLEAWAAASRDAGRPLVWFHAPSVGEGLQARAVMEPFREVCPGAQVAFTHFSPSAEGLARSMPADVADYLPLDLPAVNRRLFDALSPSLVAFSKTEVWPNLTREAERRGIPVVLLSGTLPSSSTRTSLGARVLLTPAHRRLTRVAAIAADDAVRFRELGVPPERTVVMGDARFDQVWKRARGDDTPAMVESLRDPDRPTIVAGSTWPADEDRLIDAHARIRDRARAVRLILVPHEPTDAHLSRLATRLAAAALTSARLSELAISVRDEHGNEKAGPRGREEWPTVASPRPVLPPDVLIVDRVGLLGHLYRLADVAFVGGGFGRAGLHSVLEPAAFGVPVIFGPRFSNSREAGELIAAGGGISVRSSDDLAAALERWLLDEAGRREAGERAESFVRNGLGAAGRGADLLVELLAAGSAGRADH